MLVKSNILTSAKRSIGDMAWMTTKHGLVVSERVTPANPNTQRQSNVRANLGFANAIWKFTFSPSDRQKWDDYAASTPTTSRSGNDQILTGRQWFFRTVCIQRQFSIGTSSAPPPLGETTVLTNVGVLDSFLFFRFSVTFNPDDEWVNNNGSFLLIFVGKPVSLVRQKYCGSFQAVASIAGSASSPPVSGNNLFLLSPPGIGNFNYFFRFRAVVLPNLVSTVFHVGPVRINF